MSKQDIRGVLNTITEQRAPASTIDLWPALQTRMQTSRKGRTKTASGDQQSFPKPRWLKPAFIVVALLIILTIFLSLPPGSSLAQQLIHFFNRTATNLMPFSSKVPEGAGGGGVVSSVIPNTTKINAAFEADCGSFRYPHCTIDEIRSMVDFPVFALPKEPQSFHFTGATGGPDSVTLFYEVSPNDGHLWITERPSSIEEEQLTLNVGADAVIQEVMIGDVSGEYVVGGYIGVPGGTPVWDSDKKIRTLRWVNQGVVFTLIHDEGWPDLSRYDLVNLATSLTDGPVGDSGIPIADRRASNIVVSDETKEYYPLTLAEAEELAGFKLLTPTGLPTPTYFIGARFDQNTKIVSGYYIYVDPSLIGNYIEAVVQQELIVSGETCELCGFVRTEYVPDLQSNMIGMDTWLDIVQVGDYQGLYVEGGWACCTKEEQTHMEWDSFPWVKTVRFQTDTIAVEVNGYQLDWSKSDVVDFAASFK